MDHPPSSANTLWYLKRIRSFKGISPSEMQEMERITRMEKVKKRQPLYRPGDPSSNVYLLKRGRVKTANTSPSGKEVSHFFILSRSQSWGVPAAKVLPFITMVGRT